MRVGYFFRLIVFIAAIIIEITNFSAPALADNTGTIIIMGGTCNIYDSSTEGVRLDNCTNLTDQNVNDIHFSFTYAGNELPPVNLSYQPSTFCYFANTCFGPAVAPGGVWQGIDGSTANLSDPLIYNVSTLNTVDFSFNNLMVTGYWTVNGTPVVPEARTWAAMLLGFAIIGFFLRRGLRRMGLGGADPANGRPRTVFATGPLA